MQKLFVIVILAILSYEAFGMNLRNRRQAEDTDNLEDRYGWTWNNGNNGGRFPPRPWRPKPNFPRPTPNSRPNPLPERPTPVPQTTTTTTTTTTANPNGNQINLQSCRRNCPTTSEYNPVCGTNNVSYDNPSRLYCDQNCGVDVTILRTAKCPAPNPTPTA